MRGYRLSCSGPPHGGLDSFPEEMISMLKTGQGAGRRGAGRAAAEHVETLLRRRLPRPDRDARSTSCAHELIEHGARFTVVKNTLTRRAAEAAGADALLALLEGPTAIAFLEADGDMVAVAKALADSARTTKILAIRGGILDGCADRRGGDREPRDAAAGSTSCAARCSARSSAPLTTVVGLFTAPCATWSA